MSCGKKEVESMSKDKLMTAAVANMAAAIDEVIAELHTVADAVKLLPLAGDQ
jgi:hypothetical protein